MVRKFKKSIVRMKSKPSPKNGETKITGDSVPSVPSLNQWLGESVLWDSNRDTPYKVGPYLVISGVISQFIGVITQVAQLQVHL